MDHDEHFDLGAWIDFARGLSSPEQRIAMSKHAASCTPCAETAGLFERMWLAARDMPRETVPEQWSRKAERILAERVLSTIHGLPGFAAILSFDNWMAPLPEHVRGGARPARQVIYHADDCAVDLRVDADSAWPNVLVTGQITDRRSPERALSNTPVLLLIGSRVLVSTASNDFGEFQLSFRPKRKAQISFPFNGSRIDVALDHLLKEQSEES